MIRVGGATEIEVKEKKDRVDDALNATRAAVEEGIVPGGGVALLRAEGWSTSSSRTMPTSRPASTSCCARFEAPIRQIAENAGVEGSIVCRKVLESKSDSYGFDAQTETYVDMVTAGIVDPAKVVRTALQDAASVAGLLITTEAMVAEHPEEGIPQCRCQGWHGRHGRHGLLVADGPTQNTAERPPGAAVLFRRCRRPDARSGHLLKTPSRRLQTAARSLQRFFMARFASGLHQRLDWPKLPRPTGQKSNRR